MSTPSALGLNIIIVVSEFNSVISDSLLNGAIDAYITSGGKEEDLKIYRVPEAYEIPGTVKQVLINQSLDAVVTLGSVIRGETPHFDYISLETFRGIAEISRTSNIPVINGVLTTDNLDQAEARSIIGGRNKGHEAMEAALKTIDVYKEIYSVV